MFCGSCVLYFLIPSGTPPAQKIGSSGPGTLMVRSVAFCCSVVKCFGDSSFEDRRVKDHGIYEIRANMNANSFQNPSKKQSKIDQTSSKIGVLGRLGDVLGRLGGVLRRLGGVLAQFGPILGPSWVDLGSQDGPKIDPKCDDKSTCKTMCILIAILVRFGRPTWPQLGPKMDQKSIKNRHWILDRFLEGFGEVSGNFRRFKSIVLEDPGWPGESPLL